MRGSHLICGGFVRGWYARGASRGSAPRAQCGEWHDGRGCSGCERCIWAEGEVINESRISSKAVDVPVGDLSKEAADGRLFEGGRVVAVWE